VKPRLSFRGLVVLGCLVVVTATLLFTALFLENIIRDHMVEQARKSLTGQLALLGELVGERWRPGQGVRATDALADDLGRILGLRVTLIAPDGEVLGDSRVAAAELSGLDNHGYRPEVKAALAGGVGGSLRHSATLDLDLMYAATCLKKDGRTVLVARLALPLAQVEKTLAALRRLIFIAVLLGLAFSLVVAYLAAGRISRPVRELTEATAAIAEGDLSRRLRRYASHEIGDLGRTFDHMADRLQEKIAEITSARDQLRAILGGMVEGVLVTDHEGMIIMANQALIDLLELEGDPVGCTTAEVVRSAQLLQAVREALEYGRPGAVDIRVLGTTTRFLEAQVAGLSEAGGGGVVVVFHDVTERASLEQMRRDFVANVSHELRTPLTAIQAAVETLLDSALEDPAYARRFAEVILRHGRRLTALVRDLLTLSQVESGEGQDMSQELDPAELAHTVLESLSDQAHRRGVELSLKVAPQLPKVAGNANQLEAALINLLDNAVKYCGPDGAVELAIDQQGGWVRFKVTDNGPGIAAEHLPRLFERFYRVERDRSRRLGGTGLGLAIVKHIAQAHGGRVEVDSRVGQGSVFTLWVPTARRAALKVVPS